MRRCTSSVRETRSLPIKGTYHEECRFQPSGCLCGRAPVPSGYRGEGNQSERIVDCIVHGSYCVQIGKQHGRKHEREMSNCKT